MEKITKITQPLFLIVLIIALLTFLKGFLIPFSFGLLIALIVYPVCKKLENKKVPRSIAIFISLFIVAVILSTIIFIFILQLKVLNKEIPEITIRLNQLLLDIQNWINTSFGMSIIEQNSIIDNTAKSFLTNIGNILSRFFSVAAETLFYLIILPIYSFLILFYREILVAFVRSIIPKKHKENLNIIISETIQTYFNYIKGMLWVYSIVGVLNSIGLLILGVDYAILFGITAAFMTIIPYFGIIISALLPMAFIWIETDNYLYALAVMGIFVVVQYLEANIIFPYIVGKQLGINTLVSISAIFIGAVIWGISGMILFLPFVALLKIISSHFDELKPLHNLLKMPT